ncbi:MAG: calcineurin-like phosphoesterase C-terminal domain-containing protein [Lysobacter sp.]|nr:calcineurin-like phosphoesterase C-terminal domain-containing protein [Lysobacter sp.]
MSRLRYASFLAITAIAGALHAQSLQSQASAGRVFDDANGNGVFDVGERGVADVAVSNGRDVARTDRIGNYSLSVQHGQTLFVIKPAGWRVATGSAGLPLFWKHHVPFGGVALKYGGIAPTGASAASIDFPLRRESLRKRDLEVLVFSDSQPKSMADVGYYDKDIVAPIVGKHHAQLGLTLGDIVHDDLSLYPALNAITAKLGVPWLHVAGNHDLDFDATRDEDSLLTFRNTYGPDTLAWEETAATFVVLDDVVYRPGQRPAYVGGLRDDQFAFLEAYLPTTPKDRLLVLAVHIPFFSTSPVPEWQSFRVADRERLFGLLKDFPHVLLLSGHSHTQQHVLHDADSGWHGTKPLHEYNVGAACGAFWSGVKDTAGIPDATMADGTPNGYATLRVNTGGAYALAWHPARDGSDTQIALHAPKVLRQDAYPAFAVFANVFMGRDDSKVEYRIDGGNWNPMSKTSQPDPSLVTENMRDDLAPRLRGYDRAPPAQPSPHLWRGTLPTDLAVGEHSIEVRAFDAWRGEQRAKTSYRLDVAEE